MGRFIEGEQRSQVTLLPQCLDDFISEDSPVRVVDAFVEELELRGLGFDGAAPAQTGRPSYHPAVLLKIYIYGYLNRIQASRRLEREAQRNVEQMWLTGRLAPDFKTIADFRRNYGAGIRNLCRRFVLLCRELKLFTQATVAIGSSKFKAVNSRDRNFTPAKIDKRQQQIDESIQRYLAALDTADRTLPLSEFAPKAAQLKVKLATLRAQMRRMDRMRERLKQQPAEQLSLTDPDARSMISPAKGTGLVAYNVQAVVEAKHHLIVAHEVTNLGNDRSQLSKMAQAAREAMARKTMRAHADRGYFNGPEIKACHDAGIQAFVPKPMTSNAKAEGHFGKADFVYIARDDGYLCPAGQIAIYRYTREENGLQIRRYWSSACPECPMKHRCTPSDYRRISRWEHEHVLDVMQRRLDRQPDAMTLRRSTIEHVFGTLKHWMGTTHFPMRGLEHVGTEMSLHVLAYNLKRVMQVVGIARTMKAIRLAGA